MYSLNLVKIDQDLLLKPLEASESPLIFKTIDHSRVFLRKWLPWVDYTQKEIDTRSFIENCQESFLSGEAFNYGIWFQNCFAGVISLVKIDRKNRIGTIGYWLSEDYTKKGIMQLSCRAIADLAFSLIQLNRIEILCAVGNKPSRKIPEKLGFRKEGLLRSYQLLNGEYSDVILYSMLKEEWLQE